MNRRGCRPGSERPAIVGPPASLVQGAENPGERGVQLSSDGWALLLLDYQFDFLDPAGRMPVDGSQVAAMLSATRAALDVARDHEGLVVRIANEFPPRHVLRNLLRHHAAVAGRPGSLWDPGLELPGTTYLPKSKPSAFSNQALCALLGGAGAREIVVAGVYARACVAATVRDGLDQGFAMIVLADALACRSDGTRAAAIEHMRTLGATITTTEQFAATLNKDH